MNKKQYAMFNILFVFSIISLIYTLGFFTNFTSFLGIEERFYQYAQSINKIIFNLSFFSCVIGLIIVLTKMLKHSSLILYNYVLLAGYAGINLFSGLTYFRQIPILVRHYRKADFSYIMKIDKAYQINERVFQIGNIIMILHLLMALVTIIIIIYNINIALKRRRTDDVA